MALLISQCWMEDEAITQRVSHTGIFLFSHVPTTSFDVAVVDDNITALRLRRVSCWCLDSFDRKLGLYISIYTHTHIYYCAFVAGRINDECIWLLIRRWSCKCPCVATHAHTHTHTPRHPTTSQHTCNGNASLNRRSSMSRSLPPALHPHTSLTSTFYGGTHLFF